MEKVFQLFLICSVLCFSEYTSAQKPVPKLKDKSKNGVMAYLKTIIDNNQVIVGQQCSETPDVEYNYKKSFQSLYDSTGKLPALLGLEYGYFPQIDLSKTNQFALDHWKKGGLITIGFHADNPFTDGYNVRWNSVKNKDSINLKSLLKNAPESKEKRSYRAELFQVANSLLELKKSGVIVLWRPFHEVNGTWFWWGVNDQKKPTNQEDFKALWKDMYETLTIDFGLENLIWVYSPNSSQGGTWPSISNMYPDPKYVDIVASDIYAKQLMFSDYEDLKQLEKLVANGEIGPTKESYGKFDEMQVLNNFKGKAAYFLQWHSWENAKVAIVDNLNFKEMMNNPAAITLDKLK